MMQWVSSEGATIEKMLAIGNLWVVETLPPMGMRRQRWEATAEETDTSDKLMRRWANVPLPRSSEARCRHFNEMVAPYGSSVLIIHDAHILKGKVLANMRLFAEKTAPVILVGDALTIGAKTLNELSFMQRASFCITPTRLF